MRYMKYVCPMHPEVTSNKAARCSKCGMKLVTEDQAHSHTHHSEDSKESYTPLVIIIGLVCLVTLVLAIRDNSMGIFSWQTAMMNFMAGFFLVFSAFKLLDIKGFAEGYASYDLLAQKIYSYGYVYPFIELVLGILYLLHIDSPLLNGVTFVVMLFSGLGVAVKLAKKEQFQCACLGTFLKVPLTKVTLIEDFGMALMALLMLVAPVSQLQQPAPIAMTTSHSSANHMTIIHSEKEFIVQMIPHHQEAVDSSLDVISSTKNIELKKLAEDVVTAQEKEIEQLKNWYSEWYGETYTQSPYTPMMSDLSMIDGAKKDSLYMTDMITHHQGAVDMAEQVLATNPRQEIKTLAENIIREQTKEIIILQNMLNSEEQ